MWPTNPLLALMRRHRPLLALFTNFPKVTSGSSNVGSAAGSLAHSECLSSAPSRARRALRERAATPRGNAERFLLGSGNGSGANLTVDNCRIEQQVDGGVQRFDESGFVREIDDESKDGRCSDESSLAGISCTSSGVLGQDLVDSDIWAGISPLCQRRKESGVKECEVLDTRIFFTDKQPSRRTTALQLKCRITVEDENLSPESENAQHKDIYYLYSFPYGVTYSTAADIRDPGALVTFDIIICIPLVKLSARQFRPLLQELCRKNRMS